jgi:hypothetical protein
MSSDAVPAEHQQGVPEPPEFGCGAEALGRGRVEVVAEGFDEGADRVVGSFVDVAEAPLAGDRPAEDVPSRLCRWRLSTKADSNSGGRCSPTSRDSTQSHAPRSQDRDSPRSGRCPPTVPTRGGCRRTRRSRSRVPAGAPRIRPGRSEVDDAASRERVRPAPRRAASRGATRPPRRRSRRPVRQSRLFRSLVQLVSSRPRGALRIRGDTGTNGVFARWNTDLSLPVTHRVKSSPISGHTNPTGPSRRRSRPRPPRRSACQTPFCAPPPDAEGSLALSSPATTAIGNGSRR